MLKLMGKKIYTILRSKYLFILICDLILLTHSHLEAYIVNALAMYFLEDLKYKPVRKLCLSMIMRELLF